MIKNYLKIALRNVVKSPLFFGINTLGLAIGMAACILIIRFVHFEMSFDSFHDRAGDLHRVVVRDRDGGSTYTPVPAGPVLVEELEQVEAYVRFREADGILEEPIAKVSNNEAEVIMADGAFFELLNFPLLKGDANDLQRPNTIYLTESMAMKYFGDRDPMGRELVMFENNFGKLTLEVVGVLEQPPLNTHLRLDGMISLSTIRENDNFWAKFDNWSWTEFMTYVRLKPGASLESSTMAAVLEKYVGKETLRGTGLTAGFQPVQDIHLDTSLKYEYANNRSATTISFLIAVACFILFMAIINYTNLATAKGFQRAQEVGVRKNLGASRLELIGQFCFEAILVNTIALLLAITMVQLAYPFLSTAIGGAFMTPTWQDTSLLLIVLSPVIIGILWSAFQPAMILSSFSMTQVLKGKINHYGKGLLYRKWGVVGQFVISLTLMTVSFIIYQQLKYFQSRDIGINVDQVIVVERPRQNTGNYSERSRSFQQELVSFNAIEAVSISGSIPSGGFNWASNDFSRQEGKFQDEVPHTIYVTYVDNEYYDVYQPKVLAGAAQYYGEDPSLKAVINKSALAVLGFNSAIEAVDQVIVNGDTEVKVIGVIDDYNHRSLKVTVEPAIYLLNDNAQYFSVRFSTGDDPMKTTEEVLAFLQATYEEKFPDNLFQYDFLDDRFANQYRTEANFGWVMLVFTLLSIFLAVLGVLGLSLYNLSQRTKEIGIRKVLGANVPALLWTTSSEFLKLIAIAAVPAVALAFYFSDSWLQDYPYKIELGAWMFLVPVIGMVSITVLTTSYHLIKLVQTNPVESLRYE